MFTLIRGSKIYAPAEMGVRDLLIGANKIVKVADRIDLPTSFHVEVVEAEGKIITPGFIDLHVHLRNSA
jgi:beta-aspartyl-dipeptidase (metallo-type)